MLHWGTEWGLLMAGADPLYMIHKHWVAMTSTRVMLDAQPVAVGGCCCIRLGQDSKVFDTSRVVCTESWVGLAHK